MKKIILCSVIFSLSTLLLSAQKVAVEELKKLPETQKLSEVQEHNEIHSETDSVDSDIEQQDPIVPSRTAEVKRNQTLEVTYPGSGWIYLGEMEGTTLLRYSTRKITDKDTTFSLQAKSEGSATLHFYKTDVLTGKYIDDYLTVNISGLGRISERVTAPSYADIVPPRPSFTQSSAVTKALQEKETVAVVVADSEPKSSVRYEPDTDFSESDKHAFNDKDNTLTVIQNATHENSVLESSKKNTANSENKPDTSNMSEEEILDAAQKAYDSADYSSCLAYLDDYLDRSVENADCGLFLQAQALEAPSSSRDIKKALSIYKTIINGYPESSKWDMANSRITYIERLYFTIR